ncbi:hypothetical protein [Pandoraea sputorum]|uniref:hypothetical protein n=1 Tax=Pandoraea sputorum TaxID=93222 RepID=UPI002F3E92E5
MIAFQKPTPPCVECKHFRKAQIYVHAGYGISAQCRANPTRKPDHVNGGEDVYYTTASSARKGEHCASFEQRPKFSILKFFGLPG